MNGLLTKENFLHTLRMLANVPAVGSDSLGYLPHLVYLKRISDEAGADSDFLSRAGLMLPDECRWEYFMASPRLNDELLLVFRRIVQENPEMWGDVPLRMVLPGSIVHVTRRDEWERHRGLPGVDGEEVLRYAVRVLSGISLAERDCAAPDVVSSAFEQYVRETSEFSSPSGLFTCPCLPEDVTSVAASVLDIRDGMSVMDPFCEIGDLLMAAKQQCPGCSVRGSEFTDLQAMLSQIRLHLSGDFSARVSGGDVLRFPILDEKGGLARADRVITRIVDPPEDTHPRTLMTDPFGRFDRYNGSSGTVSAMTYVCHALASLKSGGRCVAVESSRVLLRTRMRVPERVTLLVDDLLEAVIQIPGLGLRRSADVSWNILVFSRKKPENRQRKVLFVDASTLPEETRVSEVSRIVADFAELSGVSRVVDLEEVLCNDAVLSVRSYTTVLQTAPRMDMEAAYEELAKLEAEAQVLRELLKASVQGLMKLKEEGNKN